MLRVSESGGVVTIYLDGERSHLDAKALCALIGKVIGRGKVEGVIGQQNVRIVVSNESGPGGAEHQAVAP